MSVLPKFSVNIPMPPGVKPPPRSTFRSRWAFRDYVLIDGDKSIIASVVGFSFSETGTASVRCAWFANGDSKEGWFEEWRLSEASG